MELWIRSQDKERLCKPNNLFIKNYAICCFYNEQSNDTDYLGVYKTKERALEILNEIQNILQPRVIVHEPEINYDDMINSLSESVMIQSKQKVEMELKEVGQIVYQMPKE